MSQSIHSVSVFQQSTILCVSFLPRSFPSPLSNTPNNENCRVFATGAPSSMRLMSGPGPTPPQFLGLCQSPRHCARHFFFYLSPSSAFSFQQLQTPDPQWGSRHRRALIYEIDVMSRARLASPPCPHAIVLYDVLYTLSSDPGTQRLADLSSIRAISARGGRDRPTALRPPPPPPPPHTQHGKSRQVRTWR